MAEIAVGHHIINVPDDHEDLSVTVTPMVPPPAGEIKDMKLAQKNMFKVAVPSITVSAIGIVADLHVGVYAEPHNKFLLKAYAVVVLTIYAFGVGLLLLSMLLPQLPISIAVTKKLIWVAVALIHVALGLKMTLHVLS